MTGAETSLLDASGALRVGPGVELASLQIDSDWPDLIREAFSAETAFWLSILILVAGAVAGYLVWRSTRRFLEGSGVSEAVEGTPFERTVRSFGTSTVGILSLIAALFVYVAAIFLALSVARLMNTEIFWSRVTAFLPRLFIAVLAVVLGLVVGDKARLVVSERLRSIKLPEVGLIPELVKYSIFYIAALIALGQLGVAIGALLVLLGVYAIGLIALSLVAFWDLLRAGAAGIYILLSQPYGIGDRVRIGESEGIVQEVDMFTTHVESEDEEYIIPNQKVFKTGIVRLRN
ncbi:MAG: mechanosensitive ion channel domain-containing protein [Haloarculaceae archaeon]